MGDRRPAVLVVSIALFVVASCFVALLFISRIFVVRRVGRQDYLMLLAWLIDFGFSFSLFYATHLGLGLHASDISADVKPGLNRAEYAFTVLYNPTLMAVKSAILVFYLALTKSERLFRWANYVTLFVVNAAGLTLTFVNIFQCNPVGAAFISTPLADAECIDIITLYLSSSPVNIITDLAILFLPIPLLTQMRLPRKQKIILVITFGFGFFVAIVDVIRIAYLQGAATSREQDLTSIHFQDSADDDFSWYASLSFMWSVVEVNMSIICGCVPGLKPLVARIIPKMIKDTTGYSQNTAGTLPTVSRDAAMTTPNVPQLQPPPQPDADRTKSSTQTTEDASRQDADGLVDMIDFLTTPGTRPSELEADGGTTSDSYQSITFFDFVNMKNPESMLKLSTKESIAPIALTTILFFLWGFAYGLLDILNSQFQLIVHLNMWRSLGLHGAYYGGYIVGPVLALFILRKWGFKATFIVGLCIYACGTLIFWPSAVLTSFAAFTVSNLIVGIGLAVLETAANPFIALCGPQENSEIRLNISQGVQAIGSVVSPLLAKKVLFKSVNTISSLVDVQWTYLAIALFDVLLAVAFYYLPIPEASDEDLQELANRRREDNSRTILGVPVVWMTLMLGVLSQYVCVGAQEAVSTGFMSFVEASHIKTSLQPFDYLIIGHTLFATGRFLTALAQYILKPRWTLLIAYIGTIIFSALCMSTTGIAAITMGLLLYLFESSLFSTIFAISLRGTARHTKSAAALLAIGVSSGLPFPFVQHAVAVSRGVGYSYSVAVALFSAGAVFPIYLNAIPAVRKQVDPVPGEYLRRPRRSKRNPKSNIKSKPKPKKNDTLHGTGTRTRENPSRGGVLSRRRSFISEEPFTTVGNENGLPDSRSFSRNWNYGLHQHQRPSSIDTGNHSYNHSYNSNYNYNDEAEGDEVSFRDGGIMHELAPWTGGGGSRPASGSVSH